MIDPEKLKNACDQSRVFYKAARRCNEFVELDGACLDHQVAPKPVFGGECFHPRSARFAPRFTRSG